MKRRTLKMLALLLATTMLISPLNVLAAENAVEPNGGEMFMEQKEEQSPEVENPDAAETVVSEQTEENETEQKTESSVNTEPQEQATSEATEQIANEFSEETSNEVPEQTANEDSEETSNAASEQIANENPETTQNENMLTEEKQDMKWEKTETGWKLQKLSNENDEIIYYTKADGIVNLNENKYYFDEQGILVVGFADISGVEGYADGRYYFKEAEEETNTPENSDLGKMQVSIAFEKDGVQYEADEQGIISEKPQINEEESEEAITFEALQDEAVPFYAGQSYAGTLTESSRKVYRIVVTNPGILSVNLKFYMSKIRVRLYNANGDCRVDVKPSWNVNIAQGNKDYRYSLERGTYYWVLSEDYWDRSSGNFTFSSTFEDINSSEQEPNNLIAQAQKWSYSGQTLNGLMGIEDSSDIYALDFSKNTELSLKLKFYFEEFYIYIYDKDGNLEKSYSKSWNSNVRYGIFENSVFLTSGRHYVQVKSGYRGKYNLTLISNAISHPDGWFSENGNTYYYRGGQRVTGWQVISGNQYYFSRSMNSPGKMAIGFTQIGGKYYYFSGAGYRKGVMLTGLTKVGGNTYYFKSWGNNRGEMYYGWLKINGMNYYFNKSGKMLKGWNVIANNMYYFSRTSGHMYQGFSKIDNKYYYFSNASYRKGVRLTGLQQIGANLYYFEPHGATGWRLIQGHLWRFQDGKLVERAY